MKIQKDKNYWHKLIYQFIKILYSRRPLFRTRKGPEILFEIANVQNKRSFKNLTEIR